MGERVRAFVATRALIRRASLSNFHDSPSTSSPVQTRTKYGFNSAPHSLYKLVDEKGAAIDSPLFREQMQNANEWISATTTKIKNVTKLFQDAAALEAQLVTAKKTAFNALVDIAKGLSVEAFKEETRTLAMDAVQLLGQLSETESSRLTFVCHHHLHRFHPLF